MFRWDGGGIRTTTVKKRYGIRAIKHSLKYLDGRVKKYLPQ